MSKFTIDADLLGVMSFVVKNTTPHFLTQVHEQLKPDDIEDRIVAVALDMLTLENRRLLRAWAAGKETLSKTQDRYFRDIGFLYGEVPVISKKVRERCELFRKALGE